MESLPIIKNVNYNLHAHGNNTGKFFILPPNTRILIPSLPEKLYATVEAECTFAKISLLNIDATCSNIDSLIKKFLYAQHKVTNPTLNFKVYGVGTKAMKCPIINYQNEKKNRFLTGIAKCPVTIKQMYLKDQISGGYGDREETYKQKGDIITIDNPSEKIDNFLKLFKESGITTNEIGTHYNLKNDIIAHLLYPHTKKDIVVSSSAAAANTEYQFITYYDTENFSTIEHLNYDISKFLAKQYVKESLLSLENIANYYRAKVDALYGRETIITIITFACNSFASDTNIKDYEREDEGMLYDEFIETRNFASRTLSAGTEQQLEIMLLKPYLP